MAWACRCRIPAFVTLARIVRANRDRVLAAIELGLSNSRLEGINSKITLINHRGYGHHSATALIAPMTLAGQSHRGPADAHKNTHDVTITVNNSTVILPQGRYTGLEIKEAAIAQGADDVRLDFVLSVQRGNHYDVVGDSDVIQIHPDLDFVAVTGDDNS